MNFKHFICNNCENEDLDEKFLLFNSKNPPILSKTNKTDINVKSMLSVSDNNNSTDNLEIIEYPYDYHANESNINYDPEMFTPPKKSNIANKKNKYDDSDDFLDKIKPPKLHNEGKKNNKENNNDKDKKENEDLDKAKMNISIEIKDKVKNENIINNKNNTNIYDNNNNSNNIINNKGKKQSKNSSSLIDNEDNLEKNKVLLNNYYSNSPRNNINDKIVVEKKEKNNNEAIIVKENKKGINEDNNSINIYNASGMKIDYPHPDTNNFLLKSIDNIKQSNIINKKPCLKYEKNGVKNNNKNNHIKSNKKLTKSEIKNGNNNNHIKNNKKLTKNNTNIKNTKNKNNILGTINKNNTDFQIYMNNQKNKNMNNNSNSKKLILKIKLSNKKLKIKKKESLKKLKNNISNLIKEKNEYLWLKTETDNKNRLINLTKKRSRYLSNSFFNDSLRFKMNFGKRNNFSNLTEKIRPKINTFKKRRPKNESIIYSYSTYTNPFVNQNYNYNKRKQRLLYSEI